jgi:dolichyl-phosphate-mannose--protein O-mannosyl transferase
MPWGLIALVAFWVVAIRLWLVDGPKVPLIFIAIWAAGYFGFPLMGVRGFFFIAFEALLTAILLIIERYKEVT